MVQWRRGSIQEDYRFYGCDIVLQSYSSNLSLNHDRRLKHFQTAIIEDKRILAILEMVFRTAIG